jgi:hypothetical protein
MSVITVESPVPANCRTPEGATLAPEVVLGIDEGAWPQLPRRWGRAGAAGGRSRA